MNGENFLQSYSELCNIKDNKINVCISVFEVRRSKNKISENKQICPWNSSKGH